MSHLFFECVKGNSISTVTTAPYTRTSLPFYTCLIFHILFIYMWKLILSIKRRNNLCVLDYVFRWLLKCFRRFSFFTFYFYCSVIPWTSKTELRMTHKMAHFGGVHRLQKRKKIKVCVKAGCIIAVQKQLWFV